MFAAMKRRFTQRAILDSDLTTYILVGVILATILLGGLKILFF